MALKFSWSMIYLMEMKVNRTDEKFVSNFFLDFFREMFYNICIHCAEAGSAKGSSPLSCRQAKKTMGSNGITTEKIQRTDERVCLQFKVFGKMRWMLLWGIGIFC